MQQPPNRGPSTGMNLVIATLLGIPGIINIVTGISHASIGGILSGVAALVYAALLVRDALHVKKTGRPAMAQKHMLLIGFGCLSIYLLGVFLK
ncbi:hypothetical protein [Massilia sp. ST3]|uniref:hypothetical protein n=1 Tax=Massilia sp. ST3 TaxID=2824903 RepID=UPI001B846125|nr:hypothetical protein [Massilia sp. ST3]MBQ5949474.1 hypothetical protein [Massilia sp. ST3]